MRTGAEITERVLSAKDLASLPSVAVRVLELAKEQNASIPQIAEVIGQDPALTAKLLKVANSSLFGMPRKISSLQQATVALGLRTVKMLVLSFSLFDAMAESPCSGFDYYDYGRRSLTTATAGSLLADQLQLQLAEEAFVGGLLCDIGSLAAFRYAGDLYAPVLAESSARGQALEVVERLVLGTTHEEISGDLLTHWGLPESLCVCVRSHHAPVGSSVSGGRERTRLVRTVRAAAMIADVFCTEGGAGRLDSTKEEIRTALSMTEPALEQVLKTLDIQVRETAELFSVSIAPERSYQQLQAEAGAELARLSMATEMERARLAQREQAVRQECEALTDRNRELTQKATTDNLTGIGNRAALEQRLEDDCREAVSNRTSLSLILLDLDQFKKVNDTYGHLMGDEMLRSVGACIRKFTGPMQFAARYGGEEFAMVVAGATAQQICDLAENIRVAIERLRVRKGKALISATASIGVTHMRPGDPAMEPGQLIEFADRCLYHAKQTGRNRVVFGNGPKPQRRFASVH